MKTQPQQAKPKEKKAKRGNNRQMRATIAPTELELESRYTKERK